MIKSTPESYSRTQVWLHWFVVVGILIQMTFNEPITRVMAALRLGDEPLADDVVLANFHAIVGTSILVAMLVRLWLRFRRGVPAHVEGTPPLQAKLASLVHGAFYVLLISMVLTGMITNSEAADLGSVHFSISVAIFFLAIAHAAAALFNQLVRKDGTLGRMNPFK